MLINRGSSDNGIFMWDESVDKFTLGLTTADGSATGNITLSSLGTLVANLEGSVTGNITGQVSDISNFTTANLTENTNLYYTQARFDSALAAKSTTNLSEGSNLYYTDARFDTRLASKDTDDVSEGTSNLYYTSARFNSAFSGKSTSDLSEGSNLYYTDARVQAVSINNVVEDTTPQLGGNLDLNSSDITGTGDINITGTITSSGNITGTLATAAQPNITSVGTLTSFRSTGIDDNADATAITIDSSENVGIKEGSPSATLHTNSGTGNIGIHQESTDSGSYISFSDNSTTSISHVLLGAVANDLVFNAGDTERMRIDSSGVVNIGTASGTQPSYFNSYLNVQNNASTSNSSSITITAGSAGYAGLHFGDSDNGRIGQVAYNNSDNALLFTANNSERMRIDSSGNVGIGATPPSGVRTKIKGLAEATNLATSATSAALFIEPYSGSSWGLGIGSISGQKQYIQGVAAAGDSARELSLQPFGGNVGIGTTSPAATLDVQESGITVTNNQAFVANFIGDGYGTGQVCVADSATLAANVGGEIQFGGKYSGNNLTEWASVGGYKENATSGQYGGYFAIKTRANGGSQTEKMRIDSSGNLLVARTSDSGFGKLQVYGGADLAGGNVLLCRDTGNVGIGTSSPTDPLTIHNGTPSIAFKDTSSNGTMAFTLDGTTLSLFNKSTGGVFTFGTENTERMRLDSSGNVGIATNAPEAKMHIQETSGSAVAAVFKNSVSSADSSTQPLLQLQFNGDASLGTGTPFIKFANQSDFIGSITGAASSVAYNTSSDYRLKENVDYDFTALDRVAQLKPARFNFIADADTTVDGFLAHEVQDIVPEAITGEKDAVDSEGNPEYQGIDQSKLVPLLTKAIQEQQDQIDKLSKEIDKLKKR